MTLPLWFLFNQVITIKSKIDKKLIEQGVCPEKDESTLEPAQRGALIRWRNEVRGLESQIVEIHAAEQAEEKAEKAAEFGRRLAMEREARMRCDNKFAIMSLASF